MNMTEVMALFKIRKDVAEKQQKEQEEAQRSASSGSIDGFNMSGISSMMGQAGSIISGMNALKSSI